ncbi:MAG TPA: hypothetical protein VMJ52_02370 [Xanthobacteraceae bacterium]|nr:hypothetical protein [Xanthobacteraceae bacterium]
MSLRSFHSPASLAAFCALALSACTASTPPVEAPVAAPMAAPAIPSQYRPEELVGRWGYGAFHNQTDLARTTAAARGQCGQPVVINRGPNGGLMMYLADSADLQELQLKGSQSGKNYIGPPGDAGGPQDREIVSFDGRTMVLRWMDPEVAGRYGTGVYVRCAPEGAARASKPPAH